EMPGLPGRGERRSVAVAGGAALLIDESYNANPLSMAATLKQLGRETADRRIAILGGMRELGERSAELHAGLAAPMSDGGVDYAILVGAEMAPLADALAGAMPYAHVPDTASAIPLIQTEMRAGDAILVKGSNGIGLSRLIAALEQATRDGDKN
ncbi:MAG: UDP-N-acetylmuramoylalanyl-D-glutamyl-2, 6-diaminopimelate--D-alanyl-D-alanine ligase, partial [Sphingobium sp.]